MLPSDAGVTAALRQPLGAALYITPVQRPLVTGAVSALFLFQKINVMYLKKVLRLGANEQLLNVLVFKE